MIRADWPNCFPPEVFVAVSSQSDGTVLDRSVDIDSAPIITNRIRFCEAIGMDYSNVVYQRIKYGDDQTYDIIRHVSHSDTTKYLREVAADALIVDDPEVGVMLPVADCIATVVYDNRNHRLAILHLGRHSTLANLMSKALTELVKLGGAPEDFIIWMAPSVHKTHYRLEYFTHQDDPAWKSFYRQDETGIYLDMHGYNRQAALNAGVPDSQVVISPINTATSSEYFSHSQGDTKGRFAIVTVIQG